MDNVTHTLVGLIAGEAVALKSKKARAPLWIASAMGNNLPDLDILLTPTLLPGKANYLLHHRGHSHTFLVGFILGAIFLGTFWWINKKRTPLPLKEMGVLLFLGVCLHLFADYWNSYGVHPFWPMQSNWYYGDIFFIVEPWIWITTLPLVFFGVERPSIKILCVLLLALMLGLSWLHPVVPIAVSGAISTFTVVQIFLMKKMSRVFRVAWSCFCLVSLLICFGMTKETLKNRFNQFPPSAQITSLALSPYPGNPFCWNVIRSSLDDKIYKSEIFTASIGTSISFCPRWMEPGEITAPLLPLANSLSTDSIRPKGYFEADRQSWQALSATCLGDSILRFSRAPYWIQSNNKWIVGDLRFDREKTLGFSEWEFDETTACPSWVPPWRGVFHPENLPTFGK